MLHRVFKGGAWGIGVALSLLALYTAGFGLFDPIYHRSLVMGACAITVMFASPLALYYPSRRRGVTRLLWAADVAMIAGMAASILWFLSVYDLLETGIYDFSIGDQVVAVIGLGILLELARRHLGLPLALTGLFSIGYCLYGGALPWIFRHSSFSLEETVRAMWYSFDGVFGLPASVMVGYIFVFIVFGVVLEGTGAGDVLLRIAFSLTGGLRGGPAHAAIFASALFGSISGSVTGNVVGTGVFTIPMIKKRGFTNNFAGAVEAAASSGGQFMPPVMGAAAFIMAEITGISYLTICLAALMPALFYYGSLFASVLFEARRLGIEPIPKGERERLTRKDLLAAQTFLIPIMVIVGVLVTGRSPAMAGFLATLAAIGTGFLNPVLRKRPQRLLKALADAGYAAGRIMVALGVVGMIIAAMNLTGLGLRFANMVLTLGDGSLFVSLVLAMAACLVLGMGMPTVPAYLIIVLVMGPAIREMGVAIILIHLFVQYYGVLSSITPPVAVAAYAAAPIADSNPIVTGLVAVRLALIGFIIPFVFVYNPELTLVEGFTVVGFIWVVARLTFTIWMFSSALTGYDRLPIPYWSRAVRLAGGTLALFPDPYLALPAIVVCLSLAYFPEIGAVMRRQAGQTST